MASATVKLWGRLAFGCAALGWWIVGCSSNEIHDVAAGGSAGSANAGHGSVGGKTSHGGSGGTAARAQGGGGAGGGDTTDGGMGGAAGCAWGNQCGGCTAGNLIVKCSWGAVDVPWDISENQAACSAARRLFAEQGAGGAGGQGGMMSAGGAGGAAAGASSYPGLCDSYVAPGSRITSCDSCTETEEEDKVGECVIKDECCVLVFYMSCGI